MGFLNSKHDFEKKIMNSRLKTLLLLAIEDGEINEKESDFFMKLCSMEYGMSLSETINFINNIEKIDFISPTTFEDKQNHIIELIGMMFCDKVINKKEEEFIKKVAEKIGIPISTVNHWTREFAEQYKKDGIDIQTQGYDNIERGKDTVFTFVSRDHVRYENGIHVSGPHGGAKRIIEAIKIDEERIAVSVYNIDTSPIQVQMSPKIMKLKTWERNIIYFEGVGSDPNGFSFEDYALSLVLDGKRHSSGKGLSIEKIVLHLVDRNTYIEYQK